MPSSRARPRPAGDLRSEEGRRVVDQCHERYCRALRELYDAHKDTLATARLRDVRFVE
jgi:hypothetical protein